MPLIIKYLSSFYRSIIDLFIMQEAEIVHQSLSEDVEVKTLELSVVRHRNTKKFTEGRMCVDGVFMYHTLEDEEREVEDQDVLEWKIPTLTCIPRGRYEIIYHQSPRFKRKLPLLVDVAGFSYVLIHSGNKAADTEGCILVGMRNKSITDGWISNSRDAERDLVKRIDTAFSKKKRVFITMV